MLTEKEVKALEQELFDNVHLDPIEEVIWAKEQLEMNIKIEQKQLALFKYHKALRNDEGMTTTAENIRNTKKTKEYLVNRLKELNA